jgi:hypothetical protein
MIAWAIGFAALIGAFALTVVILNATIYSAHGFVASYLDTLNRHDSATARQFPGMRAPKDVKTTLLTDAALGSIADIRLKEDSADNHGIHDVRYAYKLGKQSAASDFTVEKTPAFLGLFSRWQFTKSPLATVTVTTLHDPRFRANGVQVEAAKADTATTYEVFAPGLYVFDHKSTFLTASPVSTAVTDPGSVSPVQVDVEANKTFVSEVHKELDDYLTSCAKQKVLLPTSCPFGKTFNNRVVSAPVWTMKTYPPVTIVANGTQGNWLVPRAQAVAHLKVQVQSLLTGVVGTFDEDVPFPVSFSIDIAPNNHLSITSLYG